MDVEDKLRDVFGDSDEEGGNKSDSREQSGKKEGSGGEDQAAKDLEDDVPQTRDGGALLARTHHFASRCRLDH